MPAATTSTPPPPPNRFNPSTPFNPVNDRTASHRLARWPVAVLLGLALLGASARGQGLTLVATNAVWKYFKGRSEASSPVSAWREVGFNDASWPSGAAAFYYGEDLSGTALTDMQNSYTTLFLRRTFVVEDVASVATLTLNAISDDGFLAWINGVLVASQNPPAGAPTFDSVAGGLAAEPHTYQTYELPPPGGYLREGTNVLAVQVFNVSLTSSDLVFAGELVASRKETDPPVVVAVSPTPGVVTSLTQVTVTFNEPVQGVDAADLLVNQLPAQAVTGTGASYTFTFPQPPFGTVVMNWAPTSGITDRALPPNAFDPRGPSASWLYELVDPTNPTVASLHPPANLTVRRLSQIEVTFDRAVDGVDAADLLINGAPAQAVSGRGAGPFVFVFPAQPAGPVEVRWAADHGIVEDTSARKPFGGGSYRYTVDPDQPVPDVVITEFLAENVSGLRDEDGDPEDWIELFNRGPLAVNLEGWSLTDDAGEPAKWVFPAVTLLPGRYLIVFASGKDRKATGAGARLHTNFKLGVAGEYLGLYDAESPRQGVSEFHPTFPEQRNDVSFGLDANGAWRYFHTPSPGAANGVSTITNVVAPVHFSVQRGFFSTPFTLRLATETPGATIRYTFDGSVPTEANGMEYTEPLTIDRVRIVRAAAFKTNHLPSIVRTHTYLFNVPLSRRRLPALSLVTATNNLFGRTGIMEVNPRNTTKHGIAWERPVSAEFIRPEDNEGFQVDCGIRIQGGAYIRERYDYRTSALPESKYSFRLYFRGDYGPGRLEYPLFPDTTVRSFDTIVLRAGMNDPTNPFIRDELARELASDLGQPAAHGTFVHLFLNGQYKGYYNPTERIDIDFLRTYHGGGDDWDLIAQSSEIREGDAQAWNALRNYVNANSPTNPAVYLEISRRLDLVNFIDYLLPHIYADTDDWPHNNWRAARERVPGAPFRFYMWDAEWSFGYNNPPSHDTIAGQLSSLSPPWGGTEIQRLFTRLRLSPEFRLLFADRVHKHLFNDGALTDARIRARYEGIRDQVRTTIPGFNDTIGTTWIPQRRRYLTNHLQRAGLLASSNAPVFNQFGGRVPAGFQLVMSTPAAQGTIFYTTNGADPRVMFSGAVAPQALTYTQPLTLSQDVLVKARTRVDQTNWSALTEAAFQVARLGSPLRFTELNYHPDGGEAYEFIELLNTSAAAVDLSGLSLRGVDFRFNEGTILAGGERVVLVSALNPALFSQRYPGVRIGGTFGGSLSNGGEKLALLDRDGRTLTSVTYHDADGWPTDADGAGRTLEIIDPHGDPNDPANWRASVEAGGSPGAANPVAAPPVVQLNEVFATGGEDSSATPWPDFIELFNPGGNEVSLAGWSLATGSSATTFVFPPSARLASGGYAVVWCNGPTNGGGFHAQFGLSRRGETVLLFDAQGRRVDAMSFGGQVPGFSVGRAGVDARWQLTEPTPAAINEPAPLGSPAELAINEFLANPPPGADDWLELYNLNATRPVALQGLYVGVGDALARIGSLSFVAPGGFAVLIADENAGPDHLDLKLPAAGGTIVLFDAGGQELTRLTYGAQVEGISQGRLPDGTGPIASFANSASPGAPNYQVTYDGPVLNEVMARNTGAVLDAAGRVADWIELHNPAATPFDLSGMSVSVERPAPGQWVFPAGTSIAAEGYLVVWCDGTRPASTVWTPDLNLGRSLEGESGGVYLFTRQGQLADFVEYGLQLPDRSIGRNAGGWTLLAQPTAGAANSPPASLGRADTLKINEWMAHTAGDDWFELYNPDPLPVDLAGLRLTDDPSLAGLTNTIVPPLSFIAGQGWAKFVADGQAGRANHTRFSLDRLGETLRIYSAAGSLIDSVDFDVQEREVSQGRLPDGAATITSFPGAATPGGPNGVFGNSDSDTDGLPDAWELAHGFDPNDPADAAQDADGDGQTNLAEFLSGTDPRDPTRLLRLEVTATAGSQTVLRFEAAPNRSYSVLVTDDLTRSPWPKLQDIEAAPDGRVIELRDPVGATTGSRFYRLRTPKLQ